MNLIVFYIFSFLLVMGSASVIISRNPVHSVLFLIFCFFCSSVLFLLQGAEFLALILIIIYVGAVAILFLFVIMMLNIEFKSLRKDFIKPLLFGIFIATGLFVQIYLATIYLDENIVSNGRYIIDDSQENIKNIGDLLYTEWFVHLQVVGLILLVGMIGAVMLTLRKREGVRKQNITKQVLRTRAESVKKVKVLTGKGV